MHRGLIGMLVGLALTSSAILVSAPALAAEKTVTVKGEIVDLACYLDSGAKGEAHKSCALMCLKGGQPMGLLTADGSVYLLLAPHDNGAAYEQAKTLAADQVEVTGPTAERAGIKALTVESVRKI